MITRTSLVAAATAIALLAPVGALAIGYASTPVDAQTRNRLIPAHTLIRIQMLQTVSSAFNKKGDTFSFAVVDDVMAGDRIGIPAGTKGTGKVVEARRAHMAGENGYLKVDFDPIVLKDGTQVPLGITRESLVEDQNEHNGLGPSLDEIASVTIPGFFLVDLLRKGDEITLGANRPFHVSIIEDSFLTDNR